MRKHEEICGSKHVIRRNYLKKETDEDLVTKKKVYKKWERLSHLELKKKKKIYLHKITNPQKQITNHKMSQLNIKNLWIQQVKVNEENIFEPIETKIVDVEIELNEEENKIYERIIKKIEKKI